MTCMLGLALSCCSSEFCYSHHVKKLSQLDNVRHNSQLPELSQGKKKPTFRQLIVVRLLSHIWLFVTPWTADSISLSPRVCPNSCPLCQWCLILCSPLLLLPSIFPSIRVYSNESALHIRWPKYWSFSFNICPSNEYSGLISFRTYWFDLRAVQGPRKSLLQHHSSKAAVLWCSAFFMVQLSHPCMTTGKL